jgi:CheY-like chemotaxis protein
MLEIYSDAIHFADELLSQELLPIREDAASPEPGRSRRKILVVDDQRLIADTIVEIFQYAGFEAVAAYDGWSALEIAGRLRPDLLLSDVLMPQMNGVQLAIAMRRNHPETKILLFTGQAGISEILLEGKEKGYEFELLPKPIHPLKLLERIKEQL